MTLDSVIESMKLAFKWKKNKKRLLQLLADFVIFFRIHSDKD